MPYKTTFSRLKEDEREVRKNLILESAMKLCEKMAFHEIGMRDIAKEAGVSAAAIYRYFPSRDELFVEAFIQDIITLEQQFQKWIEQNESSLIEFAVAIVDYLYENEATFQMMTYFMIKGVVNERLAARFNTVQNYFFEILDQMFIREGATGNIRNYSQSFFASLTGVAMTFRNYPGPDKHEIKMNMLRLAQMVARVFKNGTAVADET
jgi:AcrR family transcriptional regulator